MSVGSNLFHRFDTRNIYQSGSVFVDSHGSSVSFEINFTGSAVIFIDNWFLKKEAHFQIFHLHVACLMSVE